MIEHLTVTESQASRAIHIILEIVHYADEGDNELMATQLNLHPNWCRDMRELVKEIRANE